MWPVSDQFLEGLTTSGRMTTKVDLYRGPTKLADDIPISEGDVSVDGNSNVRRTLSMEVPDQSLLTLLDPYECDAHVFRGMLFANNVVEYVPMGVFRVWSLDFDRPGLRIGIEAKDRGALVDTDEFLQPDQSPGNARISDEIQRILGQAGFPNLVNLVSHQDLVHHSVIWDGTRWEAINALADSLDGSVYFDQQGVPTLGPDAPGNSVWEVAAGDNGVLVGSTVSLTREGVYNCVIAEGENPESSNPIRAVAKDLDPLSPTYWRDSVAEGGFGHAVRKESSSVWNNQTKANRAALRLLRASIGKVRTVDISAVPNPALEAGDVITVKYADGTREDLVIDSFTVPLVGGSFEMATRARRTLTF